MYDEGPLEGRGFRVSTMERSPASWEAFICYADENAEDEREVWHGIGLSFRSAIEAAWRAYWKYWDETMRQQVNDL